MLPHLTFAARLSLGLVFLISALPKLLHPRAFVQNVLEYRILPGQLASASAWALISLETFLAIAFLTGLLSPVALPIAAGTLTAFLFAVATNLSRGRKIACGCFGDPTEEISPRTAIRLLILLLVVLLVLVLTTVADTSMPSLTTLLGDASSRVYVIQSTFVAVSMILLATWVLHFPELASLLRNPQSAPLPSARSIQRKL